MEGELIMAIRSNNFSGIAGSVDKARTIIQELKTAPDCPEAAVRTILCYPMT